MKGKYHHWYGFKIFTTWLFIFVIILSRIIFLSFFLTTVHVYAAVCSREITSDHVIVMSWSATILTFFICRHRAYLKVELTVYSWNEIINNWLQFLDKFRHTIVEFGLVILSVYNECLCLIYLFCHLCATGRWSKLQGWMIQRSPVHLCDGVYMYT